LSSDLIRLIQIDVRDNQITKLSLPAGLTNLSLLILDSNPLTTLVLSELSAATRLAGLVAFLRNQGVSVFTYPLMMRLLSSRRTATENFEFTLTGPPGVYTILSSTNLTFWSELGALTNDLGSAAFTDVVAALSTHKFYRALQP